jgi:hypothetical protein
MKKQIMIMSLALIAVVVSATEVGYNVGYNSKLVEQGVVTGTSLVTAGASVEKGSIGIAVNTFSSFDQGAGVAGSKTNEGAFKRVDLTASYKFTSTFADLTFGGVYKSASKSFALGNIKDNVLPFAKINGNVFTVLPWQVTALRDYRNNNTNFEGNIELPFPVGLGKLKVVPTLGAGFNSGVTKVAALDKTDKYYQGAVALAYPTAIGTFRAGTFMQSAGFQADSKKIYGYSVSLGRTF